MKRPSKDEILEAKKKGIEDQLTADEKALEKACGVRQKEKRVADVIDEEQKKEDHEKGTCGRSEESR